MADEMDDLAGATAEDVQARIQQYNASLTGFQSGLNVSQVKAQVEGTVASLLRDQLDDMVTKGAGKAGYQDLKNTYSALRTIEKDVARQAMNQLSDKNAMATFTHLITGERLISSAVLGRPDLLGRALSMEGAGYQWLAYLWIGLARAAKVFGLRALGIPLHWLERLLETNKRWICSAYMDRAWLLGGLHMFDDGRLRAAVSPGDVAHVGWTLHADTGPWIEDGTGVD